MSDANDVLYLPRSGQDLRSVSYGADTGPGGVRARGAGALCLLEQGVHSSCIVDTYSLAECCNAGRNEGHLGRGRQRGAPVRPADRPVGAGRGARCSGEERAVGRDAAERRRAASDGLMGQDDQGVCLRYFLHNVHQEPQLLIRLEYFSIGTCARRRRR